jgi:Putative auto-transporter adhesin, head GIN domain
LLHLKPTGMRKLFLLSLLATAGFMSCDYVTGERIRGNGNIKTEDRQVSSFNNVSSHGAYDVYLIQGAAYSLRIEAEENLLPYIDTHVDGDVLEIETKDGYNLSTRRDMKVYITAPAYNTVKTFGSGNIISQARLNNTSPIQMEVSGSGNIKVDVNAPEVKAEVRGSGNIDLQGETRSFTGEIRGSGDIKSPNLKAENVTVDIGGSGSADVYASITLNVDIKGSGDVKYRGGADVRSHITGSGNVKKVD